MAKKFVKQSKNLRYLADELGVQYTELMSNRGLMLAIIDAFKEEMESASGINRELKVAKIRLFELESKIQQIGEIVDG